MNTVDRREIAKGVNFTAVADSRFKTMNICATALVPLCKDTVSAYALLTQVLSRSCAQYPDFTALSRKLSSLYGASLTAGVRKLGESLALTFSVSGIDDSFALTKESISEELSKLLCNVIFEPFFTDGAFDTNEVEQERRQLIDAVDSEVNDKRAYVNTRLMEIMCADEPYGIRRCGTVQSIRGVTGEDLVTAWKNMLTSATFEIFYVGQSSADTARNVFAEKFASVDRDLFELSTIVVPRAASVVEHTERMDVAQSKLMLGFRSEVAGEDKGITAVRLMCAILGGSANSKLFKNVREKHSLCYYCVSRFHRAKGIMTIESGVESANIDKAKKAIQAELESIRQGNVTEDEIHFAKLSVINDFISLYDTIGGIREWYLSQLGYSNIRSLEESIADFESITKDEIVAAANMMSLDTVYVLTSK